MKTKQKKEREREKMLEESAISLPISHPDLR